MAKTMSSAHDVTIRRALPSDEAAVMSLGDVYCGRDYLFAEYSSLVKEPDTYPIVAVVDNTVVGFYMTTTFDGGVTVMKRAARVAENFRGRGLFHMMEAELEKHTAHYRPQALYETIANTDRVDHLIDRFLSKGYKLVYRKRVLNKLLRLSNSELPKNDLDIDHTQSTINVHEMSREDLGVLFQAESAKPRLFPQGRLFNFYLGYRLLDENIPAIFCERGGAFFSMETNIDALGDIEKEPDENLNPNRNLQFQNGSHLSENFSNRSSESNVNTRYKIFDGGISTTDVHRVAMVTFFYCFPTSSGYLHFLDLYASPEAQVSRDHIHGHLQRHLLTARRHFPNSDGILTLTYDLHVPDELISSSLDQFGIHEILPGQERFQILYERETGKR